MALTLSIFTHLEGLMSDLYPYRVPLTLAASLVLAGALYVAWRLGGHRLLWRHRLATAIVGAPLLVVSVVLGNYLLSPLWERSFLEESSPLMVVAEVPASAAPTASEAAFAPRVASKGMFRGADSFHFGEGDALIIRTDPQTHVLRFENFSVRNGPDLYVYLSRDDKGDRVDESLNLGRLKATSGAFNYDIPSGVDVAGVRSVVVWCRQFKVQFAVAALT